MTGRQRVRGNWHLAWDEGMGMLRLEEAQRQVDRGYDVPGQSGEEGRQCPYQADSMDGSRREEVRKQARGTRPSMNQTGQPSLESAPDEKPPAG